MNRQVNTAIAAVGALCAAVAAGCFIGGPVENSCGVVVAVTPGTSAVRIGDADTILAHVVNTCGTVSDPSVTWLVEDTTVAGIQMFWPTGIIVRGKVRGQTLVRATANADTTAHVNATVLVQ